MCKPMCVQHNQDWNQHNIDNDHPLLMLAVYKIYSLYIDPLAKAQNKYWRSEFRFLDGHY
jgi:hypothetical protein